MKNSWEIYNDIMHVCVWLPRWLNSKEFACQFRRHKRLGVDPWVGNIPCRWNGNPLQYSCLENPMDRGTWWAAVHGVAKSWTWLSTNAHLSVCLSVCLSIHPSHIFLIHSFTDGHLGCLHVLAIVNNTVITMRVYISLKSFFLNVTFWA